MRLEELRTEFEALPMDEVLNSRFEDRLTWIRKPAKGSVQNYYDGRVKLIPITKIEHTCEAIEITYMKKSKLVPPGWRRLAGEEATILWTAQVYRDYYEWLGSQGQQEYENAMMRLDGKEHGVSKDELKWAPPQVRGKYAALSKEIGNKEKGLKKMLRFSGRDVERDTRGVWRIGGFREGMAKIISEWMRSVAIDARKQRDADFELIKNEELYQREAVRMKARQEAMAAMGVEDDGEPELLEAPVPKRKKRRKKAKKKKAAVNA